MKASKEISPRITPTPQDTDNGGSAEVATPPARRTLGHRITEAIKFEEHLQKSVTRRKSLRAEKLKQLRREKRRPVDSESYDDIAAALSDSSHMLATVTAHRVRLQSEAEEVVSRYTKGDDPGQY